MPAGRLPQLELECMTVLWGAPGATVAQVRAALPRRLAYTTVMTILDRMSAKGLVTRRKQGRAYAYSPQLDVEAARRQALEHLLANFFDNDPQRLLRHLAGSSDLAAAPGAAGRNPGAPRAAAAAGEPARRRTVSPALRAPHMDDSLL